MAFPAAPAGGSNIVQFVTTCAIVGVDNPLGVLAYTMTVDWLMWVDIDVVLNWNSIYWCWRERIRTITNIAGDCVIASIVQKYCHMERDQSSEDELKTITRL